MLSSRYRASPEDYWDYLHTPSFGPAYNASAMPRQNMRAIDEDDFGEQGGDPRFVGHLGGSWGAVAMEPNRGDRTPFVPQRGPGWQGPPPGRVAFPGVGVGVPARALPIQDESEDDDDEVADEEEEEGEAEDEPLPGMHDQGSGPSFRDQGNSAPPLPGMHDQGSGPSFRDQGNSAPPLPGMHDQGSGPSFRDQGNSAPPQDQGAGPSAPPSTRTGSRGALPPLQDDRTGGTDWRDNQLYNSDLYQSWINDLHPNPDEGPPPAPINPGLINSIFNDPMAAAAMLVANQAPPAAAPPPPSIFTNPTAAAANLASKAPDYKKKMVLQPNAPGLRRAPPTTTRRDNRPEWGARILPVNAPHQEPTPLYVGLRNERRDDQPEWTQGIRLANRILKGARRF